MRKFAENKKDCPMCGNIFTSNNPRRLYCSDRCSRRMSRWNRDIEIALGINHPKPEEEMEGRAKKLKRRTCHDCGKPTTDYRCPRCWAKLRRKLGLSVNETEGEAWV